MKRQRSTVKKKRLIVRKRHREFLYELSALCERFRAHVKAGQVEFFTDRGAHDAYYALNFVSYDDARASRLPEEAPVAVFVAGPGRKRLAERLEKKRKRTRTRRGKEKP